MKIVTSRHWSLAVILAAIFGISQAHAIAPTSDDVSLTESEALALFYQRNLDLIAAHYQIAQSQAQEIIASAIPNPVFSLNVLELDGSGHLGNDGAGPGVGIGVTQLLETAGKRHLRQASSALGTQSAEEDLRDATRTLTAAVRRAYYALVLAQKNAEVAQDAVNQYTRIVSVNELRLKHGDIAQSDLWRLKVEAFKAEADRITVTAARDKARADLASLLRWPSGAMHFVARMAWPVAHEAVMEDADTLISQALDKRPDLAAARKRTEQATQEFKLAKHSAVPDITIGAGFVHDINNLNQDTANLSISVPLPLFYHNQGEIQKSSISLTTAELQVQQLEQSIRKEVINDRTAWQGAEAIARGFETDALKQVQAIRVGAEQSYLKGASTILDFLDAQRNYREVMQEYQTTLFNRTVAGIDLQTALGLEGKQ